MTRQGMSSLDDPVDIVGNVGKEPASIASFKVVENIANLRRELTAFLSPFDMTGKHARLISQLSGCDAQHDFAALMRRTFSGHLVGDESLSKQENSSCVGN